jgi:hypothetical protein
LNVSETDESGIVPRSFSIDLKVANHVHVLEPQWNPMVEAQAVDRVHRIGQDREVVITRYIVRNSIETVIKDSESQAPPKSSKDHSIADEYMVI